MAATIQTIQKPTKARALDTSGNNNHGQIYSGRALEFDGVTDYLQIHSSEVAGLNSFNEEVAYSWATWINIKSLSASKNWFLGNAGSNPQMLVHSGGKLVFREDGSHGAYHYASSKAIELNTWYRLVVTADASNNLKIYLNGVLDTTISEGDSPYGGSGTFGVGANNNGTMFQMVRLGSSYTSNLYPLDGMLSDFQIWDATLTADDALYDYNNPEQLALNNGGTSLTNSNLKIWYPMNDGHRGQQSFILDASNTGLGDEMISNGDFSNGTTGWTKAGTTSATQELVDGKLRMYSGTAGDNANGMSEINTLTAGKDGVMYKLTVDMSDLDGLTTGTIRLDGNYDADHIISFTEGSNTVYFVAYRNFTDIQFFGGGHSDTYTIDNVSLKPINDKNHATTVFHGDMSDLLSSAQKTATIYESTTDSIDFYGSTSTNMVGTDKFTASGATYAIAGSNATGKGKLINTGDAAGFVYLNFTTVVGRTYRASVDIITGDNSDIDISLSATTSFNNGNSNTSINTYVGATVDFVATGTTTYFHIRNESTTTGEFSYTDNIWIREEGLASGWTDADQQLDIPQTALQSYNQLAWFDGESDAVVEIEANNDVDDIFSGGGSASVWIYVNSLGENGYGRILDKSSTTDGADGWHINTSDESGSTCKIGFQRGHSTTDGKWTTTDRVITYGNWYHVAVTYNQASASNNPLMYINGESVGVDDISSGGAPAGAPESDASQPLTIGNRSGATDRTFNGCITEVYLSDIILDQAGINTIYNDGVPLDLSIEATFIGIPGIYAGYWRNNGLAQWEDLTANNNHANINCDETMLITAGVDSSRDSQGFLMNRQRTTNSLNLCVLGSVDTGNYVSIPVKEYDIDGSPTSFSFWFKYEGVGGGAGQSILGRSTTSSTSMLTVNPTNKITIEGDTNNKYGRNNSSYTALTLGEWYHFAVTCAGDGTIITYKDGASLGATNYGTGSDIDVNMTIDQIGLSSTGSYETDSQIDDLAIYEGKALTAAEVLRNYNAGKGSHR